MGQARMVTRRQALRIAAASAVAGVAVTTCAARAHADEAVPDEASTFTATYTAWPGYASTMAESLVPGAVPVAAPASGDEAWRFAGAEGPIAPLALRQIGQTTFACLVAGGRIMKVDAATGTVSAQVDLPFPAGTAPRAVFADAVLVTALSQGRLAAFDEDLNAVWTASDTFEDGAGGDAASPVLAAAGGLIYSALAADEGEARSITLAAHADFDGAAASSAQLALSASGIAAPPQLVAQDGVVLLNDGISTVRAVGAVRDWLFADMPAAAVAEDPGCLRLANSLYAQAGRNVAFGVFSDGKAARAVVLGGGGEAAPASAGLVGSQDGSAAEGSSTAVSSSGDAGTPLLAVSASLDLGTGIPACDPVIFADRALVVLADTEGAHTHRALLLALPAAAGDDPVFEAEVDLPGLAAPLAPVPVATAWGARASEATAELLIVDAAGGVVSVEVDAPAGSSPSLRATRLRDPGTAPDTASSPLVTREGTVLLTAPGDASSSDAPSVLALAPDASRAAATPVGGAAGLDTIGSLLTGAALPNGAGIGVGALVLAAGFGAYAFIRNRGGRATQDQGLDTWRARTGDAEGANSAGPRTPDARGRR